MSAVAVLAMLISKVLQKARELSTKFFDTGQVQAQVSTQKPVQQAPEKEMQTKPKIPPKPVMSSGAAVYPKLFNIYEELNRQNEIIFEAENERNALEVQHDNLKGNAEFTKSAYTAYKGAGWEKNYGENAQNQETRSVYKQLQNYQKENITQQSEKISKSRNRGAG